MRAGSSSNADCALAGSERSIEIGIERDESGSGRLIGKMHEMVPANPRANASRRPLRTKRAAIVARSIFGAAEDFTSLRGGHSSACVRYRENLLRTGRGEQDAL